MKYCEECGKNVVELHHIIFRSQASYMANININFKYLCSDCHRGDNGPHMNKKKNLEYKLELQKKLFRLFDKDYFTEKEIKERLETTTSEARKITKKLKLYKEGYERIDIIQRLMGDHFCMSNKEKAEKTYILLQQRKRDKERIKRTDYMDHVACNIDKVMNKNYRRKSGQF